MRFVLINQLGGPTWTVQLGRRDSTTASLDDANNNANIPSPAMDLSDIITVFSNKGFTTKEMVTLLGEKLQNMLPAWSMMIS